MNITESNKLIAEFMNDPSWNSADCDGGNCFLPDWNDLMPIVERIESYGHAVEISGTYCLISSDPDWTIANIGGGDYTKLSATYEAVTNFIEWYNDIRQ